jgi:hypothetical protein
VSATPAAPSIVAQENAAEIVRMNEWLNPNDAQNTNKAIALPSVMTPKFTT